jgi:predicted DNA-binding ribbon-helix-helix protein
MADALPERREQSGDNTTALADSARPVKRSFAIKGHRTSVSMEAQFWTALHEAAALEATTPTQLVARIDAQRGTGGLSSAVRVYLLEYFRQRGANSG